MSALAKLSAVLCLALAPAAAAAGPMVSAGTNLPFDVYIEALLESPEYDENADYTKLGSVRIPYASYALRPGQADRVVVSKSGHMLRLYKDGAVIKSFYIALGSNPVGPKQFEGDKKTPEGVYVLDYVNPRSRFYKSFHISYPNRKDLQRARALGRKPGGMIMVHGQPYVPENPNPGLQASNWTDGCIALLNDDMDEFLELVAPGTVIEIRP